MHTYEFERPSVTVDTIVFDRTGQKILLIQRGKDPFKGMWAFPGGFVNPNEALPDAARRELREETGVDVEFEAPWTAIGTPGRDPRGWVITTVFLVYIYDDVEIEGMDDADDAQWFNIDDLPEMAFDHRDILNRLDLEKNLELKNV